MKARRNGLIILLVVFAGLGLFTVLQQRQEPQVVIPTGAVPFYRVFPELAVLDIAGLRIRSPENEQTLTLVRGEDGNWQAPGTMGTLNTDAASAIARTMALLPYVAVVTAADADTTLYGFQPEGILSLEIALVDGTDHVVAIGYRTPTEAGYYAFVDDRPELYVLDRAPIDYLISQLREPPVA